METIIDKKILAEIREILKEELAGALKTAHRWLRNKEGNIFVAYAWQTTYGGAHVGIYEITYDGHAKRSDYIRAFVEGSWSSNMTEAINRGILQIVEDRNQLISFERTDKDIWVRLYTIKATQSQSSSEYGSSREDTFYDTHEAYGAFGPCD